MAEAFEEHFGTPARQKEAAELGTWIFLASELLIFGGLFVAYGEYRYLFSDAFREAGREVSGGLGLAMTLVLTTSSFLTASAVGAAREGSLRVSALLFAGAILLGLAFLVMHGYEYWDSARKGELPGQWYRGDVASAGAGLFFALFWIMTGLHVLHVVVGLALLAWAAAGALRGRYSREYHTPLVTVSLYWEFVDMIWLFLFAIFYLYR